MGMFQPQNYGSDFVNSMATTAGMFNDQRRLDMAEKEQAQQQQRYAAEAETRGIQNQGLKLDNQKKVADAKIAQDLQDFTLHAARLNSGQMTPEDYSRLGGVTMDLLKSAPYLPSDPAQVPEYKQKIGTLIKGVESLRTLPASNYQYTREDNVPEINQTLDAYQSLLSKDRLGKSFTDADGSITGKAGGVYKTSGVGGFVMASGEGNKAAFVPMFSVADADGRPLVGADGKAVLVPATEDGSNGPNAKLRMVTPEEMLTKAGFAYKVLDVADKMGLADPDKRKDYVTSNLPAYMGEKGAEQVMKNNQKDTALHAYATDQDIYDGKGKLIRAATPKDKYSMGADGSVYNTADGTILRPGTPKDKTPHVAKDVGVGGGMVQDFQYNPKTERYDIPMGKPTVKHAAKESKDSAPKVGTITATHAALVRQYIPVAKEELKRQGKTEAEIAPSAEEKALGIHVSSNAVYGALDATGRAAFDRAIVIAEQYVAKDKLTPEQAVAKALADVRREFNLGDDGRVKPKSLAPSSKTTAQPAPKGMSGPAKQTANSSKPAPITATNPKTKQRIVSNDGGKSWQPM